MQFKKYINLKRLTVATELYCNTTLPLNLLVFLNLNYTNYILLYLREKLNTFHVK